MPMNRIGPAGGAGSRSRISPFVPIERHAGLRLDAPAPDAPHALGRVFRCGPHDDAPAHRQPREGIQLADPAGEIPHELVRARLRAEVCPERLRRRLAATDRPHEERNRQQRNEARHRILHVREVMRDVEALLAVQLPRHDVRPDLPEVVVHVDAAGLGLPVELPPERIDIRNAQIGVGVLLELRVDEPLMRVGGQHPHLVLPRQRFRHVPAHAGLGSAPGLARVCRQQDLHNDLAARMGRDYTGE